MIKILWCVLLQEGNGIGVKQDSEVDVDEMGLEPKHINNIILEDDDESSSSCENKMIILHDENV